MEFPPEAGKKPTLHAAHRGMWWAFAHTLVTNQFMHVHVTRDWTYPRTLA